MIQPFPDEGIGTAWNGPGKRTSPGPPDKFANPPTRIGTRSAKIADFLQKTPAGSEKAVGLGLTRKGCHLQGLAKSPGRRQGRKAGPVPQGLPLRKAGRHDPEPTGAASPWHPWPG